MKKGVGIFLVLFLVAFLSIGLVSANWFSDAWGKITGNVIYSSANGDCINVAYINPGSATEYWNGSNNVLGVKRSISPSTNSWPSIFLCSQNKFYACGWTVSNNPAATNVILGDQKGDWRCTKRGWVASGINDCRDVYYNLNNEMWDGTNNQAGVKRISANGTTIATNAWSTVFVCSNGQFYGCGWTDSNNPAATNVAIGTQKGSLFCTASGWSATQPVVPNCTSFTYSDWSACGSDGRQVRTATGTAPLPCLGGNPLTVRSCNYAASSNNVTCTDSDGGLNYYALGNLMLSNTPVLGYNTYSQDYCNGTILREAYCNLTGSVDGVNGYSQTFYTCPNGCSNGACVNSTAPVCTDSDGGLNYYAFGNITSGNLASSVGIREDTCVGGGSLREMFCLNNNGTPQLYQCPNGCSNGACIASPANCTNFLYSGWGDCNLNTNTQLRSVITSFPKNCTGGIPDLNRTCLKGEMGVMVAAGVIDNKTRIFFQNSIQELAYWTLDSNGTPISWSAFKSTPGWNLTAAGMLNNNGDTDLIFQDETGLVATWMMNSNFSINSIYILLNSTNKWQLKTVGDLNGDGITDLFYQEPSGKVAAWIMNANVTMNRAVTILGTSSSWQLRAVGDLNGDRINDLFWQLPSGQVAAWIMNANGTMNRAVTVLNTTSSWKLKTAIDINRDGIADLIYQESKGVVAAWIMNANGSVAYARAMPFKPDNFNNVDNIYLDLAVLCSKPSNYYYNWVYFDLSKTVSLSLAPSWYDTNGNSVSGAGINNWYSNGNWGFLIPTSCNGICNVSSIPSMHSGIKLCNGSQTSECIDPKVLTAMGCNVNAANAYISGGTNLGSSISDFFNNLISRITGNVIARVTGYNIFSDIGNAIGDALKTIRDCFRTSGQCSESWMCRARTNPDATSIYTKNCYKSTESASGSKKTDCDYCADANTLMKGSCNVQKLSPLSWDQINCPGGCSNGACKAGGSGASNSKVANINAGASATGSIRGGPSCGTLLAKNGVNGNTNGACNACPDGFTNYGATYDCQIACCGSGGSSTSNGGASAPVVSGSSVIRGGPSCGDLLKKNGVNGNTNGACNACPDGFTNYGATYDCQQMCCGKK